jgi:hypothetical protein
MRHFHKRFDVAGNRNTMHAAILATVVFSYAWEPHAEDPEFYHASCWSNGPQLYEDHIGTSAFKFAGACGLHLSDHMSGNVHVFS